MQVLRRALLVRSIGYQLSAPSNYRSTHFIRYSSSKPVKAGDSEAIPVTFHYDSTGEDILVHGKKGESLLDIAHANDIELEGACEGSLACSTCHVILTKTAYAKLEEPSDEENDMLDLAFGLTATSRLGCQVKLSRELSSESKTEGKEAASGLYVRIPSVTRNMAVDGYKPPKH